VLFAAIFCIFPKMRLLLVLLLALLAFSATASAGRSRSLQRLLEARDDAALIEADADAELDTEAELDMAVDVDAEAELDAELDADMDAEADMEAEVEAGYSINAAQLQKATGCSAAAASQFLGPINAAAAKFSIDTAKRMAGFLAQVGHETGGLATLSENLNYDAASLVKVFSSYFTKANAAQYARNPQKIANRAYAGRMGNGNEASGDGYKYRGRGLIQITGKAMYQQAGSAIGQNLVANPDLLLQPTHAAMSAAWYFNSKGCNAAADRGDVRGMTAAINSGLVGLADRQKRYNAAKAALGVK